MSSQSPDSPSPSQCAPYECTGWCPNTSFQGARLPDSSAWICAFCVSGSWLLMPSARAVHDWAGGKSSTRCCCRGLPATCARVCARRSGMSRRARWDASETREGPQRGRGAESVLTWRVGPVLVTVLGEQRRGVDEDEVDLPPQRRHLPRALLERPPRVLSAHSKRAMRHTAPALCVRRGTNERVWEAALHQSSARPAAAAWGAASAGPWLRARSSARLRPGLVTS